MSLCIMGKKKSKFFLFPWLWCERVWEVPGYTIWFFSQAGDLCVPSSLHSRVHMFLSLEFQPSITGGCLGCRPGSVETSRCWSRLVLPGPEFHPSPIPSGRAGLSPSQCPYVVLSFVVCSRSNGIYRSFQVGSCFSLPAELLQVSTMRTGII